jgi:hypothetical protein
MLMEQKNKGVKMSQEEILSEAISPQKRAELIDRLNNLKETLNQVEARVAEQHKETVELLNPQDLDKKIKMLQLIGYETRENVATLTGIQLTEKYHPSIQNMLKNLDKVNAAYTIILDGLISK